MNNPNTSDINSYAAPVADTRFGAAPLSEQTVGSYYAMSVTKLWIMSILTFGLYDLAFFYRHWRHLRDHHGRPLSPFWRTIFSSFMYFGLNAQVSEVARLYQVSVSSILGIAPFLYFGVHVVSRMSESSFAEASAAFDVLAFVVVPFGTYSLTLTQSAVNRILEKERYTGAVNSKATVGSVIAGVIGALLWCLVLLSFAL